MKLSDWWLMRHELLLFITIVAVMLGEIYTKPGSKNKIFLVALSMFSVVAAIGIFPVPHGELFGGMYKTDAVRTLVKNILQIGSLVVMFQSIEWLRQLEKQEKIGEYFVIILASLLGMFFMISAGDLMMLYIGLETATIPLAVLAAYDSYRNQSAEAGVKLILLSALSTGVMLFGISMIYGTTGSIYFAEIATRFGSNPLQILAFVFLFSGFAFKIAIVPFHFWAPDVYEGAPMNITSYLSTISKGAAAFALVLVLYTVFGSIADIWHPMIYTLAIITMLVGNLFALRQKNMKRFLAYSSIAQAGFILLGIMGNSQAGMASVVYFLLVYVFSNLAAFGVISAIYYTTGKENMNDYKGLYKTNPKLTLLFTLALFSLAGIPPLAGFFGKYFLFYAAAQEGYYILVLFGLLNTVVSLYYYLLPVKAMLIDTNDNPIPHIKTPFLTGAAIIFCVVAIVITGLVPDFYDYAFSVSFGIK